MKKITITAFLLLCVFQLSLVSFAIYKGIKKGTRITLDCRLYDPLHPIKGRYVQLHYDFQTILFSEHPYLQEIITKESKDAVLYCQYDTDIRDIGMIALEKPDGTQPYVKGRVSWVTDDSFGIAVNFDKYYMQEDMAPLAEKLLRTNDDSINPQVELIVLKDGSARIHTLMVYGEDIETYLRKHKEELQ